MYTGKVVRCYASSIMSTQSVLVYMYGDNIFIDVRTAGVGTVPHQSC